jgi:hypothetical protein
MRARPQEWIGSSDALQATHSKTQSHRLDSGWFLIARAKPLL